MVHIQLSPLGSYEKNGQKFTVTPALVQCAVEYYNATRKAAGQLLVIDYEHQSLTGAEAPAAGWIHALTNDGKDGLGADVEWNRRAQDYIKGDEYKYISPVLAYNYPDEKTGAKIPMVLFNAALTNVPFLPDVKEVVAKANAGYYRAEVLEMFTNDNYTLNSLLIGGNSMADSPQDIIKNMAVAAGLPETTTADELASFLKKCVDFMKSIPEKMEGEGPIAPTDGAPAPVVEAEKAMMAAKEGMACRATLAKVIGCKADTTTLVAEVTKLMGGQTTKEDADVKALRAELNELKGKQAERDADAFILSNAKRIPPAAKAAYREMFLTNSAQAQKIVSLLPEHDLSKDITPDTSPTKTFELTADLKAWAKANGVSEDSLMNGMKLDKQMKEGN